MDIFSSIMRRTQVPRFLLPVLAAVLLLPAAARPDEAALQDITLEQAMADALKNNRDLRMASLSLDSGAVGLARARSDFKVTARPEIKADASGDRVSDSYGLTVSKKTVFGTEARIGGQATVEKPDGDSPDVHRNTLVVEVEQPLLRKLGRLVNEEPLVQAENSVKTLRREVEMRKADLVVQVAETHEELLKLQRQVEYEKKTLERMSGFRKLTRTREKQGRATRVDSLRADLKEGNAQSRMNALQESLKSLRLAFAELLGAAASTAYWAVPAPRLAVSATNEAFAVATALKCRLDYAQILQDLEDARRGVTIARRNLLPDLKMISRYEKIGEGATASDASRLDDHVWFVGLALSSDLPLRNETLAADEAGIRLESAELKTDALRSAIARQVRQALLAYNRLQEERVLAERNHAVANDRVRLSRRLFEMGKGDNFSVSDAEEELRQAEDQMLSAQADASVAVYRLKRVLGTLMDYPPDLAPLEEKQK